MIALIIFLAVALIKYLYFASGYEIKDYKDFLVIGLPSLIIGGLIGKGITEFLEIMGYNFNILQL